MMNKSQLVHHASVNDPQDLASVAPPDRFHSRSRCFALALGHSQTVAYGNKHFYFIMQTATYELYYLPKGAENVIYPWQRNHTVCVKVQHNIFILNHKGKLYPQNKNVHSLFLWS